MAELRRGLDRFRVFVHGEVQVRAAPHHRHVVPVLVVQKAAQTGQASRSRGGIPLWVGEEHQRPAEKAEKVDTARSLYSTASCFSTFPSMLALSARWLPTDALTPNRHHRQRQHVSLHNEPASVASLRSAGKITARSAIIRGCSKSARFH